MTFEKRAVRTDGRTIKEIATSKPADYDYSGVVVPTFEDAHTHLADRNLKVEPGTAIDKVVRPPDGLKHQYLRSAPPKEISQSIKAGIEQLVRGGCTRTHDFREGGMAGIEAFREALGAVDPGRREHFNAVVLGRPGTSLARPANEKEFWEKLRRLLASCDGLGLSAISDGDPVWNAEVARFARREGKLVEVHCSEVEREPIAAVLEAGAQLVVHMVRGEAEDFEMLAERRVPVAVCPRSNEFFGLRAPVERMVEAEVDIRMGTDNAFLGPPDMFEEARAFARIHKARAHLSAMQILGFLLRKKGINESAPIAPREGSQPDFLIVDLQSERPDRDLIVKAKSEDVLAVVGVQGGA